MGKGGGGGGDTDPIQALQNASLGDLSHTLKKEYTFHRPVSEDEVVVPSAASLRFVGMWGPSSYNTAEGDRNRSMIMARSGDNYALSTSWFLVPYSELKTAHIMGLI